MSAIHTRQKTESMKLIPITRAWLIASQAAHSPTRPISQRAARGRCGQAAGPPRNATAPPTSHNAPAAHQVAAGACTVQPAASDSAQAAARTKAIASANPPAA